MLQCRSILFLIDNRSVKSTLKAFLLEEKGKSRPTCALHPAGICSLSCALCKLSAQIAGAQTPWVSGLPFEGQLTPILLTRVWALHVTRLHTSVP